MKKFTFLIFIVAGLFVVQSNQTQAQHVSDTTLNSLFELDLEALMNLDIYSVSKKVESLFDAPLSASVLTREEILNSGVTSIPEALRLVPGVIVREKTTGNYDVHIRGNDDALGTKLLYSENTMSLVMIDNRIVYSSFQGGTFWETLPIGLIDIERIEVVRGPSSALYGPNAVMGVIHIITVDGGDKKFSASANLQAGTLNTKIASAAIGISPVKNLKLRISANYKFMDRVQSNYYSMHLRRYVPIDSLGILQKPGFNPFGPQPPLLADADQYYPNPDVARDNYGVNFDGFYEINDKVNFDLALGMQNSQVQTVYIDNSSVPMNTRESETNYLNFQTKIYGLNARVSYMDGKQNLYLGATNPNFEYGLTQLDAILEYDYNWKNLIIRPGVSYQNSVYDVGKYSSESNQGFFSGSKELTSYAIHLRAEYLFFNKLKLIAAVRGDKYNKPDDTYLSFQFAGSFKVDEKSLIRAVYSRANQGPFMLDTYTDLIIPIQPPYVYFELYGNDNLNLATTDMFELGFRNKLTDKIQSDVEVFYNVTKDFAIPVVNLQNSLNANFENVPMKSYQFGLTGSLDFLISRKLRIKGFGTLQSTMLTDWLSKVNHSEYGYDTTVFAFVDKKHKATPTFYGGIIANYSLNDKINVFANLYYYSQQEFLYNDATTNEIEQVNINAKAIVDMKISYKVWKENTVFINCRNLLNDSNKEFAFGDDTQGMYLVGLNLLF